MEQEKSLSPLPIPDVTLLGQRATRSHGRANSPQMEQDNSMPPSSMPYVTSLGQRATRSRGRGQKWDTPYSEDWPVRRVLTTQECVVPDRLLKLPPNNYSYVDSQGRLKDPNKYAWGERPVADPGRPLKIHLTLARHIKNGTATKSNRLWYENMDDHSWAPIAGIIAPKPKKNKTVRKRPLDEISSEPSDTVTLRGASQKPSSALGLPAVANELIEPTNPAEHLEHASTRRRNKKYVKSHSNSSVGGKLPFTTIDKARDS
jgi:hypothetical protein